MALGHLLAEAGEPRLTNLFYWRKTTLNLKQAIRSITNLHHAVDAIAIGLVSDLLVPNHAGGLHDTLARGIIKGRLNGEERQAFEAVRNQLGIRKFYRWSSARCDDPNALRPSAGQGGVLCLDELDAESKRQIIAVLTEARTYRIVQHQPATWRGMPAMMNPWRVKEKDGIRAVLVQGKRGTNNARKETTKLVRLAKLVGVDPSGGHGKLQEQKAALELAENYAVAILDHLPASPIPEGTKKKGRKPPLAVTPEIVPYRNVRSELETLTRRNGGHKLRLLRKGAVIYVPNGNYLPGHWRIFSIKNTGDRGIAVDVGAVDGVDVRHQNQVVHNLIRDGMQIVESGLAGSAAPKIEIGEKP